LIADLSQVALFVPLNDIRTIRNNKLEYAASIRYNVIVIINKYDIIVSLFVVKMTDGHTVNAITRGKVLISRKQYM